MYIPALDGEIGEEYTDNSQQSWIILYDEDYEQASIETNTGELAIRITPEQAKEVKRLAEECIQRGENDDE